MEGREKTECTLQLAEFMDAKFKSHANEIIRTERMLKMKEFNTDILHTDFYTSFVMCEMQTVSQIKSNQIRDRKFYRILLLMCRRKMNNDLGQTCPTRPMT